MVSLPIHYAELETIYAKTLGRGTRSLAIVAAESGEGVSTLAVALAQRNEVAGHKTLLVDLNLYRPSIHVRFNLQRHAWEPVPSSIPDAIEQLDNGCLWVLTASTSERSLVRWREKQIITETIAGWLATFKTVIFDTSPLNAVNRGNIPAELLAGQCDAAILIALAGRTSEESIRSARSRLDDAGAKLVGAVLNDKYNPHLVDELCREAHRLDRWFPGVMGKIRQRVRKSDLLSAEI